MTQRQPTNRTDVLLVGAGIMSATLAVLLKELDSSLKIEMYEVSAGPGRVCHPLFQSNPGPAP
jgi:malate dehydrogenase (quinone)